MIEIRAEFLIRSVPTLYQQRTQILAAHFNKTAALDGSRIYYLQVALNRRFSARIKSRFDNLIHVKRNG